MSNKRDLQRLRATLAERQLRVTLTEIIRRLERIEHRLLTEAKHGEQAPAAHPDDDHETVAKDICGPAQSAQA
jgi:hypothetical protein